MHGPPLPRPSGPAMPAPLLQKPRVGASLAALRHLSTPRRLASLAVDRPEIAATRRVTSWTNSGRWESSRQNSRCPEHPLARRFGATVRFSSLCGVKNQCLSLFADGGNCSFDETARRLSGDTEVLADFAVAALASICKTETPLNCETGARVQDLK